ncbi:citrate synthase [Ceratobasidium sp. 394]|nr:citrate synthase [Ceratobasidium sp. 394]KAG9099320.1 citrate synthase [Ceratobasidium sp. UAMH 11750]
MIHPFCGRHIQKFYWGVYASVNEAVKKHPKVEVAVKFASSRSTKDIVGSSQIKAVTLIAEGAPERLAREILRAALEKGVLIIGPAAVGGIKPGCFRIGNSGGIIASKLYHAGSVGYVSKLGGMSNELNNILSLVTDGTYEGIAISEADPDCKTLVLLGEVGGVEEHRVTEAVKAGQITKPIIAWAIGTCAKTFATEV